MFVIYYTHSHTARSVDRPRIRGSCSGAVLYADHPPCRADASKRRTYLRALNVPPASPGPCRGIVWHHNRSLPAEAWRRVSA